MLSPSTTCKQTYNVSASSICVMFTLLLMTRTRFKWDRDYSLLLTYTPPSSHYTCQQAFSALVNISAMHCLTVFSKRSNF